MSKIYIYWTLWWIMKNQYRLREVTPVSMCCVIGTCPAVYLIERTPKSMRECFAGLGCSAIYEPKSITPKHLRCGVGPCPEVFEGKEGDYLIIGKITAAKQFGLEKKVGDGEVLISIPKKFIDEMER